MRLPLHSTVLYRTRVLWNSSLILEFGLSYSELVLYCTALHCTVLRLTIRDVQFSF